MFHNLSSTWTKLIVALYENAARFFCLLDIGFSFDSGSSALYFLTVNFAIKRNRLFDDFRKEGFDGRYPRHLMCRGDARTGFVSSLYKGHRTTAHLAVGETFTIERNDTKTEITRIDDLTFKVDSFQKAV